CVDTNVGDGLDCSAELPPLAACQAGVCTSQDCNAAGGDSSCDSLAECTSIFAGICTVGGTCDPEANDALGTSCDDGLGPLSGECDGGGTCIDICTANPACPDDAPGIPNHSVCTAASCDPANGACSQAPTNNGGVCDFSGPASADGTCATGVCIFTPPDCGTTSGTVPIGCTNGVTSAQSPFPNSLTVTVNEPVFGSTAFTADASGVGAFPQFFLDAAQATVPGGVRAAIVEGFNAMVAAYNGSGTILLQADPSAVTPGLTQFCTFPSSTICTVDGDCTVPPCLPPVLLIDVPIAEDCGPAGFCEGIGQGFADGPGAQCNITDPPSFCVTGDLAVPLYAPGGPQPLTAGVSGDVVFNWVSDPITVTCPAVTGQGPGCINGDAGTVPDGAFILPASIYGDPVGTPASVGLNGIRLNVAGALFVALQCEPGLDGGSCSVTTDSGCLVDGDCPAAETCVGVGVDDDIIMPTDLSLTPTRCLIN
ncbi:MAG: hypothetical protein JRF54_01740, partial [Deltaproteobacteria bacterium]|nr:hypothetical protein [Deltaproteobacteria bacterium]